MARRPSAPPNPRAEALRAQARAHRLLADAEEAEAAALEAEVTAPDPSELLSARAWPADLAPLTWRAAFEAARRGELPIVRAGRTPALRRADVAAWLDARTERRPRLVVAAAGDEYSAIAAAAGRRAR
jgi:hypothetical protein